MERENASPSRLRWLREFWFSDIPPLDESELGKTWDGKKAEEQNYVLQPLRRERSEVAADLKSATNNVNTATTVIAIVFAALGLTTPESIAGWLRSAAVCMVGAAILILIWSYMPRTREAWLRLRNKLPVRSDCDTGRAEYIQLKQDIHRDQRRLWRANCYQGLALHMCAVVVVVGCWTVVRG